jgi:hypothetical protein
MLRSRRPVRRQYLLHRSRMRRLLLQCQFRVLLGRKRLLPLSITDPVTNTHSNTIADPHSNTEHDAITLTHAQRDTVSLVQHHAITLELPNRMRLRGERRLWYGELLRAGQAPRRQEMKKRE